MSVIKGQRRLRKIAQNLEEDSPLSNVDKQFLINALKQISFGENAEFALQVRAKRGERNSRRNTLRKFNDQLIFSWIYTATMTEKDGGLGMTIKEAASVIKENFPNLPTEETLVRQYNNAKKDLGNIFYIHEI